MNGEQAYVLVRADLLPEAMRRTVEVQRLLAAGACRSVQEAVQEAGLARSTYYKYRDGVRPFIMCPPRRWALLWLKAGATAGLLGRVAESVETGGGRILAAGQGVHGAGAATVWLLVECQGPLAPLVEALQAIAGVEAAGVAEDTGSGGPEWTGGMQAWSRSPC
ncbi:MAG: hypothetical protein QHH05_02490 [Syntrophomonadaceae bacterium]|nr:hypothetical protein [Syntrophomonadaceae bacterium]